MTKLALFFLGTFALGLAITVEAASGILMRYEVASGPLATVGDVPAPGIGIRSLLFLDAVLAYSLALIAVDFSAPIRAPFSRVQGVLTFVLGIFGALVAILFVTASINLVTIMLALLMSPPFGTLAYFAIWGHFDKTHARVILDLCIFLKIVGLALLVISSPSIVKNRNLMLLLGLSLGLTFVLGLLHAFPPSFLVAIADGLGAIITVIVALVWMILLLIGAISSIIRALRSLVPV
jgi:hypothetical protein